MTATLAELLSVKTAEEEENALLSVLKDLGFPVTDWEPGGAGQTIQKALGFILADHGKYVAIVTAGGHVQLARDLADPTWLDLIGEQVYALKRARATYTKQLCLITCLPGFGPLTINAGFTVRSRSKNLYVYQGAPVTIADGTSVNIEFTAQSPGARFSDPVNSIVEIITPLPGLDVKNPPRPFGRLSGSNATRNPANRGSGAVVPSGSPIIPRIFTIIIAVTGTAGVSGTVRIEWLQGGVTSSVTLSPIPASYLIGDGVTVAFLDGVGAGFIRDDRFNFETIGSATTANGVDDETQESYAARMIGRWPSLSLNIVADKYEAWVRQASLDGAYGIEKITVSPSASVSGQTDITVATASGAPAGGTLTALQDYVNARDGVTDSANVAGAANVDVNIAGNVVVKASKAAAVYAAADENWLEYIAALPIGGDRSTGFPGLVRLAKLEQALMDAGAEDVDGLIINGFATNLALTLTQVAVVPSGSEPSVALNWIVVA